METLPTEIIDIILEFQGYHIWRNGKYIHRLYLHDKKYDEIKKRTIPTQDIYTSVYSVQINKLINNYSYVYILSTSIYGNKIHWYMDKYIYDNKHKLINDQSMMTIHYVFGRNSKQHLPRKI